MTISRPIHVAANDIISFFSMAQWYSIIYMYHIFFIPSSANGHLGCFHVLAIINSATTKPLNLWLLNFYNSMLTDFLFNPLMVAQRLKHLPAMRETWVWSLGWEDPLEKEMATHSCILAWRIPWMEEPGGLQSMGSHRVGHDWAT